MAYEVFDFEFEVLPIEKQYRIDQRVLAGIAFFDALGKKIGSFFVAGSVETPTVVAPVKARVVPPVLLRRE